MPTVKDALEHAKWLVSKGRADEPAKLILPRIEAQRRAVNREKRSKVQFDVTPAQYADFHKQLKRIREHCVNVTMATDVMNKWLAKLTPEIMDLIVEGGFDEAQGRSGDNGPTVS